MKSWFNKETSAPSIRYLLPNTAHEVPTCICHLAVPKNLFPLTSVEAEKMFRQLKIIKTKLFTQMFQEF